MIRSGFEKGCRYFLRLGAVNGHVFIPALQQQKPFSLPATIKVSKNLYTAMTRLLSRMEYDDDNDM